MMNLVEFSIKMVGKRVKVVGLTGGIACGKSAVSGILRDEGFHIIDCD